MVLASRGEALRLIEGSSKRYHSVLSAKLMRILARTFHEDEGEWELVGLLHDLDHDLVHGDMSRHGMAAAEMLKGKLSESCLHAIRAHDRRTGVEPQGILDESLIFADALATLMEDQAVTTAVDEVALDRALEEESKTKPWISENIHAFYRRTGVSVLQILQSL